MSTDWHLRQEKEINRMHFTKWTFDLPGVFRPDKTEYWKENYDLFNWNERDAGFFGWRGEEYSDYP